MRVRSNISLLVGILGLLLCTDDGYSYAPAERFVFQQDTIPKDSIKADSLNKPYAPSKKPTYQPAYRFGDPFSNRRSPSPFFLADPTTIDFDVEYDSVFRYSVYERIGDVNFRPTTTMTFQEYDTYTTNEITKAYFQERSEGLEGESAVSGRSLIPRLYISPMFDRLFGGSYVDIQPNGFVNLDFGGRFQRTDNPQLSQRQQRYGGFNFDQQISLNLVGKVGEKLAVTANFDNNNTFDFQNNLKVEYTGYEEDIVKKIEIGNVSMPVSNSLMTGAQSLFGVKTQLQFGKLFVTSVISRQQGRSEVLTIEQGFQGKEFEVRGSDYDENRHFFLGHFFRDNYEKWHRNLPVLISGVNITRVEVYVINRNNETQTTRQVAAFLDLGEGGGLDGRNIHRRGHAQIGNGQGDVPSSNLANNLYNSLNSAPGLRSKDDINTILQSDFGFQESTDYVKVGTARKLEESEYEINKKLGYISLLRKLQNDEMLAVSYEYTYNGRDYKVGELTEDYARRAENEVIFMKMLRPNKINTRIPSWDLMMKNIYYLNATQIERDGFQLRVRYRDDASGIDNPSLHEGRRTTNIPLVELLKLDQLNQNNDKQKDGNFDYIEGVTIDAREGYIKFPVLEPFGSTLNAYFDPDEAAFREKYVYDTLYQGTKNDAQQVSAKDKFFITGRFNAGSASEITLPGINIAEGSVRVTAGSTPLTEGLDYTVDYNLGRVRLINDGILNSGKTINIAYEKADLFNFQARWLYGTRFDYQFNENFNIGATVLHLNERPGGVTRYQIGDEPTSNTKYGFDIAFQEDVPFLTKAMDFLPLVSTKEPSKVTFNAEFAQMKPATSNVINGEGTSYIDDFENSVTTIGMDAWSAWTLASTPQTRDEKFTGGAPSPTSLTYNNKRAKIAWYSIDPTVFYRSAGSINKPSNINDDDLLNHYVRPIGAQEIYRQRDRQQIVTFEQTFDIAYYPRERGQYNYNTNLGPEGLFNENEARSNWGGITRSVGNEIDFDKNNVEYIEFWMMDPFITGPNGAVLDGLTNPQYTSNRHGKLVFNLGEISEDLIPDNRHNFESGLPPDGDPNDTEESAWGRVPSEPFLLDFFENSKASRENQDIGLDGLDDEEEASKFPAFSNTGDPSADNFLHFLNSEYDSRNAKILERYKSWNGLEGNSPFTTGGFPQASTTRPDNEDLNEDNGVGTLEEYYEYEVVLNPDRMVVGENHIVDEIESQNGESKWYLFRIPIRDPHDTYGAVSGFKNIKFMRMYLTGFADPVVLRMADLQLVRSQWRKYLDALNEPGLNEVPEKSVSDFSVSVVNIEGNSTGSDTKSPYVIPPGVKRDQDNTAYINRELNEQSLQICVDELEDKDARAVFKNVSFDLLNYGRIKMFFHAESYLGDNVRDGEVTGFLRLGTEQSDNYYEIEIPLMITPPGISPGDPNLERIVWPVENEIDLSINELLGIKAQRNKEKRDISVPYSRMSPDGKHKITVKGNPDMSTILTMMVGVRNPESPDQTPKSVCIWANELRVTDFDTKKGWAANARLSTKLADVATVNASTRYTSIGFGSIQQTIQQRTRRETIQYDVSANVNVDKFMLPHKTGLVVPMFVGYEKSASTPQFDPLDPDTPLKASLEVLETQSQKDAYRRLVEERSERRSINFTNVHKEKVKEDAKKHFYDIENMSFSYAYSEARTSNINTQIFIQRNVSGGLSYNYSPPAFAIEPFAKVGFLDNSYFQLIQDVNFSPLPSNLSFRTDLNRNFRKTQLYNEDLTTNGILPNYERLFTYSRTYGLRWSPFKSLNFDYSARANAVIDELDSLDGKPIVEGGINTQEEKEYIWDQIKSLGRMKNFDQDVSATYKLPIDKFPVTDWLGADVKYAVGYSWLAGSRNQNDSYGNFFGHTAQNSRDRAANAKADLTKLYNKVGFLKDASATSRTEEEGFNVGKGALRFLMMLKNVNATFNVREGTTLPGFMNTPYLLGMDDSWNAPGWKFLLGEQDPDIRFEAANNGWISRSPELTNPYEQTFSTNLAFRASLEPFRDLKIQLDATRTNNASFQEIFRFDTLQGEFVSLTPARSGSYSISFLPIKTSFMKIRPDNTNATFEQFVENIETMLVRQTQENPNGRYDTLSQDVLIPAFLSAYSGQDANTSNLSPFPKIPLPNWRVDYTGLSKIPFIAEHFSSFAISHGYRSIYNVNNYTNSLQYSDITLDNNILDYPKAFKTDSIDGRLIPVYIINQVTISEQYTPLIGFNVRTKSNISARIEYKKERNLSLQMSNSQVTETRNNDFTLDFGFTKSDFKLPFKVKGRTIGFENDVSFRMAMTLRDAVTIQRKIEGNDDKITNGNTNFQFRPSFTYKLNNQLDLTAYFERSVNEPKISAFKTATTAFGFQLRFSLTQ